MKDPIKYIISSRDSGFTLIEMIVSLVLMSILVAVFGMGLVSAVESYEFSRINVEIAQRGQMAMARIGKELREATRMITVTGDTFILYERIQDVGGEEKRVRMALYLNPSTQRLELFTNLPEDQTEIPTYAGYPIVDEVQNFSLKYFSGTQKLDTLTATSDLATVQIALSLKRYDSPRPQLFITLIHVRNAKTTGGATTNTSTAF